MASSLQLASPNSRSISGTPTAPRTMAADRLTKVKQSLNNMSETLKDGIDQRKEVEENKIMEVREMVSKLEKHLSLEIKRRTEADRAIQTAFEDQLAAISDRSDSAHSDTLKNMQLSIELLTKKIVSLERELADEREHTQRLAVELRHAATSSVVDVRAALEQEKVDRQEKESQILRKISEDTYRIHEETEEERTAREAAMSKIREDITISQRQREKDDEKFKTKVVDDLECLKAAVQIETEAREAGEEQLAQAMDTVVQQVQDSLQVVVR